MGDKFKKGDKISIKKRFAERDKLLKPFLIKYGGPVLVHATLNDKLFKKILDDGCLKVPKADKKIDHAFIERIAGIYPSIFLSLSFTYAASYHFKYNFIFNLNYLKNSKYFINSLSYQAYKRILLYWDEKHPEYIEEFSRISKKCRMTLNKFYTVKYAGKTKRLFDYWKVEKEMFLLIKKYWDKNIRAIIRQVVSEKLVKYPYSLRNAKNEYSSDNAPEVIVKKDISLKNNRNFLGFYIRGRLSPVLRNRLITEYPDKIFFDGKRIINVRDLK